MNIESVRYSLTLILKRIKLVKQHRDDLKLTFEFFEKLKPLEEQINYLMGVLDLEKEDEISKTNELLVNKLYDHIQKINTGMVIGDNKAEFEFSNWGSLIRMVIDKKEIPDINKFFHDQFEKWDKQ